MRALALLLLLAGQIGQQTPTRDAAPVAPRPIGTSAIAGVVVSDEAAPKPVRRASVMLTAGIALPQSTITDDNGRFAFPNLVAGTYTIVVSKAGFVTSYYKAPRPARGPGMPIAVAEGQRITDISMRLLHGSAISGVVRRSSGQPAVGVAVEATAIDTVNGQRRSVLQSMGTAVTDDRGTYRIFGLAPGDYLVSAASDIIGAMNAGIRQVSTDELRWADQATAAIGATVGTPPEAGPPVTYSTVYFPGTPDAGGATIVTLGPNEDRSGVDFPTLLVPTAKITGLVTDTDGRPMPNAQVQAQRKQNPGAGVSSTNDLVLSMIGQSGARSNNDGQYVISGVTPGEYTVTARGTPRAPGAETPAATGARNPLAELPMGLFGGGLAGSTLWASQDVNVQGRDVSDLALRLQPGMTVSGKIVYQSGSQATPPDPTRSRISLSTLPTGSSQIDMLRSMMQASLATVTADGAFTIKGVMPGQYRVTVFSPGLLFNQQIPGAGDGWVLKSALLDGRDISDLPLDVRPGEDLTGITVTFTDRPTELSGSVLDQSGRAIGNFPIVVFSTDRNYWTLASRRVQLIRPSSDGKFKTTALPPGEYYVCAVTDADETGIYDPSFLELLMPGSFKITLADGEHKRQDLKLAGGTP